MKVTLRDVAHEAGVAMGTASKVLNGRPDVGTGTRNRVLEAARHLGYRPRSGSWPDEDSPTRSILAVLDGVTTMYSATVLDGIIDGARSMGLEVLIRSGVEGVAGDLPHDCVGVVVVTVAATFVDDSAMARLRVPVVGIDPHQPTSREMMTVSATNWLGGRMATEHLIELGHQRIGWLGGFDNTAASRDRRDGYRAAILHAGLPLATELELSGSFSYESGLKNILELLALREPPTAVVAANDEIALGAMEGIRSLSKSVPGDISVVGFDDTPQAQWSTPQLTTVRQPLLDMGRIAVSMVLSAAGGGIVESKHVQVHTSLVTRSSTARPRH